MNWKDRSLPWIRCFNFAALSAGSVVAIDTANYYGALGWFIASLYALLLVTRKESD